MPSPSYRELLEADKPPEYLDMGVYKRELYKFVYDFFGDDPAAGDAKVAILDKITDNNFTLDHATVSALQRTDADGDDLGNTSQQIIGLLAAEFPGDFAIEGLLSLIKSSLSDLCDGSSCEYVAFLADKTSMAKAFKFITESIVVMGDSSEFFDQFTIDNELIVSYNYKTDGAVDPSGLHEFTRENLFDEAGPTGTPIFSFVSTPGAYAMDQLNTDFNAVMRTAEGYNIDQQLMFDFITAPVLDLTQYEVDKALQAMTNMPESVSGDFKTNLEYVFKQLTSRNAYDEIIFMSDQERQDLASLMTSAAGRNAICVASHVNALQSTGTNVGADPETMYASFESERWTWDDLYKTPCNHFRSGYTVKINKKILYKFC